MDRVQNWKPGDVAMSRVPLRSQPGHGLLAEGYGDLPAVRTHSGGWAALEDVDYFWESEYTFHGGSPRPLVVIDPEDREQLDALTKALVEACHAHGNTIVAGNGIHPETMQAALRNIANPTPPIEEPKSVGSVLIDRDGDKWTRYSDESGSFWINRHGFTQPFRLINAVRVLSEGVPAEAKS